MRQTGERDKCDKWDEWHERDQWEERDEWCQWDERDKWEERDEWGKRDKTNETNQMTMSQLFNVLTLIQQSSQANIYIKLGKIFNK